MGAPKAAGTDQATADYVVTIAPNANGVAVGADRESTFAVAQFRKTDRRWQLVTTRLRTASAEDVQRPR